MLAVYSCCCLLYVFILVNINLDLLLARLNKHAVKIKGFIVTGARCLIFNLFQCTEQLLHLAIGYLKVFYCNLGLIIAVLAIISVICDNSRDGQFPFLSRNCFFMNVGQLYFYKIHQKQFCSLLMILCTPKRLSLMFVYNNMIICSFYGPTF